MKLGSRARALHLLPLGLLAALAFACGEPETPESRVRAVLAGIEAAAEEGDVGAFEGLVSPSYRDAYGHDKRRLADYVRMHVLSHPRGRHVILRVRDVQLTSEATASVMAHAGFVGEGLDVLRADAYALDVDLALEAGEWRVTWAQWRSVAPAELL